MSSPSRANNHEENTPPVSNKTVLRTPLYMFRDGKYVELDVEEAAQLQLQQQQLLQQEEEHDSDPQQQQQQQQPDDEEDGIYKDTPPAEKRFRLPAIIERPLHSCHQQSENREKRRLYLWLSSVAILVVIFSIMLGILVAHRNNNKNMNSNTTMINTGNNEVTGILPQPTTTSPPTANYNDNISSNTIISTSSLTIEEFRVMCNDVDGNNNSIMMTSNLSEELLQRRQDLAALLPDLPITLAHSCHATNLALLWLAAHIPQEDSLEEFQNRFILTTLYLATRGESWKSNDVWLNPDVKTCQWKGVSCDEADEEIIGLSLNGMHLNGTLPGEEMAQLLPNLEKLDLSMNHLTGTIPVKLVTLPNISELNLAFNRFTGTIPTEIFDQTQLGKYFTLPDLTP